MKLADDGDHFTKLAHKEPEPSAFVFEGEVGHPLGQFSEINKVGLRVELCIPVGKL